MHRTEPRLPATDLGAVLEQLAGELRALARRFHIPQEDADDILQDTAVAFLSRCGEIHSPRAWIISVFRKRCLLYWRSRRRQFIEAIDCALLEEITGTEGRQEARDLRRDLRRALSTLSGRCRRVLGLRYGLECSSPEIAERIGAKAATVRQVTLRCLSALSRCLVSNGFAEEHR